MKTFKLMAKGLLGASVISLCAAGSAYAGGTQAGTNVQNTFTLDYNVGGVAQPQIDTGPSGTNTPTEFTVDRLVDLTVASSADTTVAPGETDAELVFTVTNDGNDLMAYEFDLVNETGDEFDATGLNITYYIDNGTGGVCDATDLAGSGTAYTPGSGTASSDLAADGTICVVVDGDIPVSRVDTDESEISLVANTLYASTHTPVIVTDTPGSEVLPDAGGVNALTGAAENVLADATGTASSGDGNNDGAHSATGTYIVASANLAATKAVTIFSQDGTGCSTIPGSPAAGEQYPVPGACVEYVISAVNSGATAAATNIDISDTLPNDLEFINAAQGVFTGASLSQPAANTDCNAGACVVTLTGGTLAAGATGTLTIRALIK